VKKIRSQLRYVGLWPAGHAPMRQPAELTPAAKRLAMSAIEQLNRLGVTVTLDTDALDGRSGIRARFRSVKAMPSTARRIVEIHGDLIEAHLIEVYLTETSP
jgi:hypothetical protein